MLKNNNLHIDERGFNKYIFTSLYTLYSLDLQWMIIEYYN